MNPIDAVVQDSIASAQRSRPGRKFKALVNTEEYSADSKFPKMVATAVVLATDYDAKVAELEKKLRRFGRHFESCMYVQTGEHGCTCGWDEACPALADSEKP